MQNMRMTVNVYFQIMVLVYKLYSYLSIKADPEIKLVKPGTPFY